MRIAGVFFMVIIGTYLFSQSSQNSFSFCYKLSEDIKEKEVKRYLNARDYLLQDSIIYGKSIYFSPFLADLDFFYFNDVISEDSTLYNKLSLKCKWFDDYYSFRLDSIMGKQNRGMDYLAFFSLIENDMLRVDVFRKRQEIHSLEFRHVSLFPEDNIPAYLIVFKENSDTIKSVFMMEIIYD